MKVEFFISFRICLFPFSRLSLSLSFCWSLNLFKKGGFRGPQAYLYSILFCKGPLFWYTHFLSLLSLSTVIHIQQCKGGVFKPKAADKEFQRLRQHVQYLWQKPARPLSLLFYLLQGLAYLFQKHSSNFYSNFSMFVNFVTYPFQFWTLSQLGLSHFSDWSPYKNRRWVIEVSSSVQVHGSAWPRFRRRCADSRLGSRAGRFGPNLVRIGRLRWIGLLVIGMYSYDRGCEEKEEQLIGVSGGMSAGFFTRIGNFGWP